VVVVVVVVVVSDTFGVVVFFSIKASGHKLQEGPTSQGDSKVYLPSVCSTTPFGNMLGGTKDSKTGGDRLGLYPVGQDSHERQFAQKLLSFLRMSGLSPPNTPGWS
jgi:hypothetical protein